MGWLLSNPIKRNHEGIASRVIRPRIEHLMDCLVPGRGKRIYLFSEGSRAALWYTCPTIQCVQESVSPGIKQWVHGGDHSPLYCQG